MNGHVNYCSASCPCSGGEGDCDSDAECATGLTCVTNVGPEYGLPAGTDVCIDLDP